MPCNSHPYEGKVTCEQRDLFTAEELAKQDAETAEWVAQAKRRIVKTLPLVAKIKTDHRGKSATGTSPCPVCGKTVRWSHAGSNNHISMQCETQDCINFME